MVIESAAGVFGIGSLGGALSEVLHWWNLRQNQDWPDYARRVMYWIITLLMIGVSGVLAWIYFGEHAEAVLAIHVGISTPLLLQKLVSSLPRNDGAKNLIAKQPPSIRGFFTW